MNFETNLTLSIYSWEQTPDSVYVQGSHQQSTVICHLKPTSFALIFLFEKEKD